jgi:O-succinylbenzoic acid--CoA ligase
MTEKHAAVPALRPGDVVAVALAPGPGWLDLVRAAREAEAALLPLDHRMPGPAMRALLSRARPAWLVTAEGWTRSEPGGPAAPEVALIVATSGSRARPRLVELPRTAVDAAVSASLATLEAGPADAWVSCLPLFHIGGLLVLLRCLASGARLEFRDAAELAPAGGFAFASVVPTQLVRALEAGTDLAGYRALLVGGAGMDPALRRRAGAAGARCVATYGLTQSCGGVVYDGLPLPGVSMRVSDSGEIELSGPTLMRGYRDPGGPAADPDDWRTADGWLRTGDAGWIDESGRLRVRGRIGDLIVTGGEKVWPADVEAALRSHPGVLDCAVHGRPDPEWGMRVVAQVVPADPGAPPTLEALREHVGGILGRHQAPRELVVTATLPRTALGKVRPERIT